MRDVHLSLHSLHKTVGDLIEDSLSPDCKLIRDVTCGGNQQIPLFYTKEKSRKTEYCNVDLIVIRENKIKIIVEIEESNVKPTQTCGKFLTSALTNYYIHSSNHDVPIGMHNSVIFIQIVDTSKLKEDKTSKYEQWENLERSINNIIPLKDSKIKQYRLFYGDEFYFADRDKCSQFVAYIKETCENKRR